MPRNTKSLVSNEPVWPPAVVRTTSLSLPANEYHTPPAVALIVWPAQVAVGSPVAVELTVVPLTAWPQIIGNDPAAEHRSLAGAGITVKLPALVAVPFGVVTLMVPDVALTGTLVEMVVLLVTVKVAAVPLKLTAVVPEKLVPVKVTAVAGVPLVGEKLVSVGAPTGTVKTAALVAVPPPPVTTLRGPVMAPAETVAVIEVAEPTAKLAAATPLKRTAEASVKLVPVMVTTVPAPPLVGVKLLMVGEYE